jgi:hypothetical protein
MVLSLSLQAGMQQCSSLSQMENTNHVDAEIKSTKII